MATYLTNITLKDAFVKDYAVLENELKQFSFAPESKPVWRSGKDHLPFDKPVIFTTKGDAIQDVIKHVLDAARKTGRLFTFTVIKNKN